SGSAPVTHQSSSVHAVPVHVVCSTTPPLPQILIEVSAGPPLEAVAAMWTLLPIHAPFGGVVMLTVGPAGLETVTVTAADVCVLPAASRATAVSVCVPFAAVVVSHESEYGAVMSSAPRFAPSSLNCTPTTPTLSLVVAVTVAAVPDTVAPFVGAVIETTGGVVSGTVLETVTVTVADVAVLPAASRATAVNVCVPFDAAVVSHVMEYGAVVASAPRSMPSSLNCTPATPTLSLAFALTVTVPVRLAPAVGAVSVTVGGVVSPPPPPLQLVAGAPDGTT